MGFLILFHVILPLNPIYVLKTSFHKPSFYRSLQETDRSLQESDRSLQNCKLINYSV